MAREVTRLELRLGESRHAKVLENMILGQFGPFSALIFTNVGGGEVEKVIVENPALPKGSLHHGNTPHFNGGCTPVAILAVFTIEQGTFYQKCTK